MLFHQKPLADLQVGESFQVTVTEADWNKALAAQTKRFSSADCAVAQSLLRRGVSHALAVGPTYMHHHLHHFSHDGWPTVRAYDERKPFPGPTLVTFTRES